MHSVQLHARLRIIVAPGRMPSIRRDMFSAIVVPDPDTQQGLSRELHLLFFTSSCHQGFQDQGAAAQADHCIVRTFTPPPESCIYSPHALHWSRALQCHHSSASLGCGCPSPDVCQQPCRANIHLHCTAQHRAQVDNPVFEPRALQGSLSFRVCPLKASRPSRETLAL